MTLDRAYQPQVLVDTAHLARPDWLAYRRQGLGGSDAAAVLGISPFRTARDLYYDKLGVVTADDQDNWVALEMGNLLEPLVARIFSKKTGLPVYQRKCMFQHPRFPWMLADLDYLTELPDGRTAILEIKTTNYNARNKWWYNGEEIVPGYYEAQGRHYMCVTNLDVVYFCCLYGNNEDEVILRRIDRDLDYEAELIALEASFWENHIQARTPPAYTEDGDLILESLRRARGPSDEETLPAALSQAQSTLVSRYLALQSEKKRYDADTSSIEAELQQLKALIIAGMDGRTTAFTEDGCTVTWKPVRKRAVSKENLERLKAVHPDIYAEYATTSESWRFQIKPPKPDVA